MMNIELEYGAGDESVYVYYFPSTVKDKHKWPCKIGRAKRGIKRRISGQKAGMLEAPVIGLVINTDNCIRDEMIIQTLMRNDKIKASFGNEWYETNPQLVLDVYINAGSVLTLGQQIRIARHVQGMSQTDLAYCAGLRQATISKIENDNNVQLDSVIECLRELKMRIKLIDVPEEPNNGVRLFEK